MKTIYKIARTELQTLFYSPIAWLILVIFTFQASMAFTNGLAGNVKSGIGVRALQRDDGRLCRMAGDVYRDATILVSLYSVVDHGVDEPGIE